MNKITKKKGRYNTSIKWDYDIRIEKRINENKKVSKQFFKSILKHKLGKKKEVYKRIKPLSINRFQYRFGISDSALRIC